MLWHIVVLKLSPESILNPLFGLFSKVQGSVPTLISLTCEGTPDWLIGAPIVLKPHLLHL